MLITTNPKQNKQINKMTVLHRWFSVKESWQCRRCGFNPWVGKIPRRRKWQPTPVFLCGESHGQRSLAGYSPWGRKRVRHNLATKQQEKQPQPRVGFIVCRASRPKSRLGNILQDAVEIVQETMIACMEDREVQREERDGESQGKWGDLERGSRVEENRKLPATVWINSISLRFGT